MRATAAAGGELGGPFRVAVDRHPSRLALTAEFGATHTIDAGETDPAAEIRRICGGLCPSRCSA